MKITIHRGTDQIGGCVTEIEHDGYKLFVDFGEQLPGSNSINTNLSVEGLTYGDVSKSTLLISHYHGDHVGKVYDTPNDLPVFIGETAHKILMCYMTRLTHIQDKNEADKYKRMLDRITRFHLFSAPKTFCAGPFSITPLMIDHSAFDAYMFIIEAHGVRILHTSDFRGHGFRGQALRKLLHYYVSHIDYVISEGTNVSRPDVVNDSEQSLKLRFIDAFREHKYNFVSVSSTNVDRIFSLYHASQITGRLFVCDEYQMQIMQIVAESHGAKSPFYQLPNQDEYKYIVLHRSSQNMDLFNIPEALDNLLMKKGFCALVRTTPLFKNFMQQYDSTNDLAVYLSMYKGYLDQKLPAFNSRLAELLEGYIPIYRHTSGHCDVRTLAELLEIIKPSKGVIPIHTELPEAFDVLFGHIAPIIHLHDGESIHCECYD